jgi:hypothetical protein
MLSPRKARNSHGNFMFVMNSPEFRQAIEVEQCDGAGESCRTGSDAPSSGVTSCRQAFATHRLYAMDGEGRQVYDSFSLPSACLCHFRSSFGLKFGQVGGGAAVASSQLPVCRQAVSIYVPSQTHPR